MPIEPSLKAYWENGQFTVGIIDTNGKPFAMHFSKGPLFFTESIVIIDGIAFTAYGTHFRVPRGIKLIYQHSIELYVFTDEGLHIYNIQTPEKTDFIPQ